MGHDEMLNLLIKWGLEKRYNCSREPTILRVGRAGMEKLHKIKNTEVKSILVNEDKKVVTVIFADGDVQMSKCSSEDRFDVTVGVALCYLYHIQGSKNQAHKFIKGKAKVLVKKGKPGCKVKANKKKVEASETE